MVDKVNLESCFAKVDRTFTPKIVGELNGQHVKVAKLEGDKVPLHVHEEEDELFWVISGVLDVEVVGETTTLHPGEFCIVEKGREHRVVPREPVELVLFEPAGIRHTGDVCSEITVEQYEWLE